MQVASAASKPAARPVLQTAARSIVGLASVLANSKRVDQSTLSSIGRKLYAHAQERIQKSGEEHSARAGHRSAFSYALQPSHLLEVANDDQQAYACAVGTLSFGDGCSISCPAGQYAASCVDGGWNGPFPNPPVASCADCPAGYYDHKPDQTCDGCSQCASGEFSSAGATGCSTCSSSCLSGEQATECSVSADMTCNCPAGSYGSSASFPASTANACTSCGENQYQDEAGKTTCKSCDTCPSGQALHTACSTTTNTKCQCDVGYAGFAGGFLFGAQSCSPCGANMYQYNTGQATCKSCPSNSVRSEGSDATKCACNPGYQGGGTDVSGCTACDIGKFKTTTASDESCTSCGEGYTTTATGSTSSAACVCDAGYYPNNGGCSACPTGFYKPSAGNTACTICPTGSSSAAGSTAVTDCTCTAGYHGSAGSCSPCEAGKYQDEANKSSCKTCPTGSTTQSTGASSRSGCECSAGHTGQVTESTNSCVACETGKFKTSIGSEACSSCSGNLQSLSTTTENCVCKPGFTTDACLACAAGTYKSTTGNGDCTSCPANSNSPEASTSASACQCDPGYMGTITSASSSCTQCAAGATYQPNAGQHSCLSCSSCTSASTSFAEACTTTADTQCECKAGYVRADGAAGAFVHGSTTCGSCPSGQYSLAGQACQVCDACPSSSNLVSSCNGNNAQCECKPGYSSNTASFYAHDADPCTQCETGTAKSDSGSGSCQSCGAGKYADVKGLTACKDCPSMSTHSSTGAHDVNTCVCSTGYTMTVTNGVASCDAVIVVNNDSSNDGLHWAAILGIVLGSLVVAALIAYGIYKFVQYQRNQSTTTTGGGDDNAGNGGVQDLSNGYSNGGPRSNVGPLG